MSKCPDDTGTPWGRHRSRDFDSAEWMARRIGRRSARSDGAADARAGISAFRSGSPTTRFARVLRGLKRTGFARISPATATRSGRTSDVVTLRKFTIDIVGLLLATTTFLLDLLRSTSMTSTSKPPIPEVPQSFAPRSLSSSLRRSPSLGSRLLAACQGVVSIRGCYRTWGRSQLGATRRP